MLNFWLPISGITYFQNIFISPLHHDYVAGHSSHKFCEHEPAVGGGSTEITSETNRISAFSRAGRFLLPAAAAIVLLAACGSSHKAVAKDKPHKDSLPSRAGAGVGKDASATDVTVTGPTTYIVWPDLKRPGKNVALLWAKGFKGDVPSQTVYVTLTGVTGKLFQNGVPSATFSAPQATGDSGKQTIVATGRVTFTSLTDKGTSIIADRVDWSAKTNRGIATGNVIMHYGKSGMTAHTSKLYFDTALKTVESPPVTGTFHSRI